MLLVIGALCHSVEDEMVEHHTQLHLLLVQLRLHTRHVSFSIKGQVWFYRMHAMEQMHDT